uniref:Uncharacterized protein n=1 Tax=Romanomermis culicivorax TaxID=13658 RepID=A0A915KQJ5_ROMCU
MSFTSVCSGVCAFPLIALLNDAKKGQLIKDCLIEVTHHSLHHLFLMLQDLSYERQYLVTKCLGIKPTLLPDIRSSVVPGNQPIARFRDTASKLVPLILFGSALLKDLKDLGQGDKLLRGAAHLLNNWPLVPSTSFPRSWPYDHNSPGSYCNNRDTDCNNQHYSDHKNVRFSDENQGKRCC